jgi:hypothetical protein
VDVDRTILPPEETAYITLSARRPFDQAQVDAYRRYQVTIIVVAEFSYLDHLGRQRDSPFNVICFGPLVAPLDYEDEEAERYPRYDDVSLHARRQD